MWHLDLAMPVDPFTQPPLRRFHNACRDQEIGVLQRLAAAGLAAVLVAGNAAPALAATAKAAAPTGPKQGEVLEQLLASKPSKVLKGGKVESVPSYSEIKKQNAQPAKKKAAPAKKAAPPAKKAAAAPKKKEAAAKPSAFKLSGGVGSGTQVGACLPACQGTPIALRLWRCCQSCK